MYALEQAIQQPILDHAVEPLDYILDLSFANKLMIIFSEILVITKGIRG